MTAPSTTLLMRRCCFNRSSSTSYRPLPSLLPVHNFFSRSTRLVSSIGNRGIDDLSKQMQALCAQLQPTREQLDEKDAFLSRLQRTIEGVVPGSAVAPFGSAVNGFWSPNSDIDVCVQTPGCRSRNEQITALRKIASSLHSISSHFIEPRFGAKVPIIHWAPRRSGYLACDISINNNLAVVNSRLLGAYCTIDPRVSILGFTIKHWAKARGINDRSRGTLSSFSLLLMLIHFLQRRSPPILPSLQDLALVHNEPLMYLQGSDVRFMTDPSAIASEMTRLTNGVPNEESVGKLLCDFFKFYGYDYKQGVIGIRDLTSFNDSEEAVFLVVDNPFEVGKDVANVAPSQYSRIRQEFRRAKQLIDTSSTVSLSDICSQADLPKGNVKPGLHPLDPPMQNLGRPKSTKSRSS